MKQNMKRIAREWAEGKVQQRELDYGYLWGGAGLIIWDEPREDSALVVVTKHAANISRLLYEIRDAALEHLDYMDRYYFYLELGEAALQAIREHGDEEEAIARAIIRRATELADEMGERPDSYLYFAYGSNMDEAQMERRCPGAKLIGKVILPGYRFALDTRGVATVLPGDNDLDAVEGLLWDVTRDHIKSLDRYEGVAVGCYRKDSVEVRDEEYRFYDALVYLSNSEPSETGGRTGYMENIVRQAEKHGFSPKYVKELYARSER